jgi:hypothetical protein
MTWLLITGSWLRVTGYEFLVVDIWLLVTGYWLMVWADGLFGCFLVSGNHPGGMTRFFLCKLYGYLRRPRRGRTSLPLLQSCRCLTPPGSWFITVAFWL